MRSSLVFKMYSWSENRIKPIASATLMAFFASWLMFVCQTCFASLQEAELVILPSETTNTSCHTADSSHHEQTVKPVAADTHCLGACDCDQLSASLNSVSKTENTAEKALYFPVAIASISSVVDFHKSYTQPHPVPVIPERAIFLPHQHYVVLLI